MWVSLAVLLSGPEGFDAPDGLTGDRAATAGYHARLWDPSDLRPGLLPPRRARRSVPARDTSSERLPEDALGSEAEASDLNSVPILVPKDTA